MANNIAVDPIYLDSAVSGILTPGGPQIVRSVEWVKPLGIDDRAYLLDTDGSVICDFTCVTPKKNLWKWFGDKGQEFTAPFTLSTLDSGYLLVQRF